MKNKKLLVHLHLYYKDQINYMLRKLRNITGINWDLYITSNELDDVTKNKILKFKPDANIILVDNLGYDVLPFIKIIQSVNLSEYEYVLKIHTKNKQRKIWLKEYHRKGYWWRNVLIEALLSNKYRFRKNLKILNKIPKIGLICSEIFLWDTENVWPEDTYLLEDELKTLNFKSNYRKYCAGTMFLARAEIYKFLQNIDLNSKNFSKISNTKSTGTLAHVYERVLTIAADEYGFEIYTVKNNIEHLKNFASKYGRNIISLNNSINKKGEKCKILTLLGLKIRIK